MALLSRRKFLQRSFQLGGLAALSPRIAQSMLVEGGSPHNLASPSFNPDVELELVCRPGTASILKGPETRLFRYYASLLKGPENTLTTLPDSYLGRILRLQRGQKIRVFLRNGLAEPTITHWHGLHVPEVADGHPQYAIKPGETFVYEFEVRNRAGMNIYHPHPHMATARQVYFGLAGAILVNDDEERALDLPGGEFELPLVIQDRRFDDQNQLVYAGNMHERMLGYYGDRVLVNGRPDYRVDVASRAYRLRILNGSNARIYKLAWDDGTPIIVLGVDGGLLDKPISKEYVLLAPGERLDVWADFSHRPLGAELGMRSRPFSGVLPMAAGHMAGMAGTLSASGLPVGSDYPLFTFRVVRALSDSPKLPKQLATLHFPSPDALANPQQPIPIGISEGPMGMLLNGRSYAMNDLLPEERIRLNSVQLLEIFHAHGGHAGGRMAGMAMGSMRMGGMGDMGGMGMMMSMAHPIHLHGQQFQILERQMPAEQGEAYASVREGFVDGGWKDTVLVMPGERVRIIKPFQDYKGLFMYHCHNLEHEDLGMMREFLVE